MMSMVDFFFAHDVPLVQRLHPTTSSPMPQTKINDLPVEYDYEQLTPADVENIKKDPTKEIDDYTFDEHAVLSADDIAEKVRFVYLEGQRMRSNDAATTADDVKQFVIQSDTAMEAFSHSHPRIFAIVCNPDANAIELDAIRKMLELKKEQENGRSEASVLADVEKMVISSANLKRASSA
jgi:hypothetical protein